MPRLSSLSGPPILEFSFECLWGAVRCIWVCCCWAGAGGKTIAVATSSAKFGPGSEREGLEGARRFAPVVGHGGEDMLFIFVGGWLRRLIQASQYIPTYVHIHLYDHSSGDKEIERWGQRREIHFMRGEMITDWIRD